MMTKIRKRDKAKLKRLSRKYSDDIVKKVRGFLIDGDQFETAKKKALEK